MVQDVGKDVPSGFVDLLLNKHLNSHLMKCSDKPQGVTSAE